MQSKITHASLIATYLGSFFELAPRTKTSFGVRRNFDPTLDNLRKNGVALGHITRMIRFIHLMLYMEGPPELLYQLLEDLGRRHLKYNCQPQMVPLMGQAFILALESYLGREMWNAKVQSAWESIFDLIENRMTSGMSKK